VKRIFTFIIFLFLFIPCQVIEANFPGRNLFDASQQKLKAATACLVDNAWKIAGTAFFATATITTIIIAKKTINDTTTTTLLAALNKNSIRMLLPLASSIMSLLCFNIDSNLCEIKNNHTNILINIMSNLQDLKDKQLSEEAKNYIEND
jgi:hypothetical protein